MQEKNLKLLRFEIDTIDDQLLKLLIQRSSIVEKIGNIKQNSDNVVDKDRESKIISRLLDLHKGNFAKDSIVRIWREIFHTSANIQLKKNNVLRSKRGIDSIKLYKGGTSKISGINKIIKLSSNEKSHTITKEPFIAETLLANVINLFLIFSATSTLTPLKSAIKFLISVVVFKSEKLLSAPNLKTSVFSVIFIT